METQKIVNLLNDIELTIKTQNLQEENGMLLIMNQKVIIHAMIQ